MVCLVIALYNCKEQLTESCLYFLLYTSALWELLQAGANASRSSRFIRIRTQIMEQNSLSKLNVTQCANVWGYGGTEDNFCNYIL